MINWNKHYERWEQNSKRKYQADPMQIGSGTREKLLESDK